MKAQPPDYLTPEQVELFTKLANGVVKRRLTTPTILFLESVRPLNYVGSQAMLFFAPLVSSLFTMRQYELIQQALERRESLGYMTDLLEELEEAQLVEDKQIKLARKAEKLAKKEAKKNR